jgi:2,4-dienoyl-CoA reductase-like NADH-dependent reductase (Old Yellow Enzyme family)
MAKSISKIAFGVPSEIDQREINLIIGKFAHAAKLAAESGFAGVEIHASHGYLLDQFLDKQTNLRTDVYGGNAVDRARLLAEVIAAVRKVLPAGCGIGVLVSAVEEKNDEALKDRLEQLDAIIEAGVDYIHISGGTFEKPAVCPYSQAIVTCYMTNRL